MSTGTPRRSGRIAGQPEARILLRSPKRPFEVLDLEAILARSIFANNTGKLVFVHAAYRILATRRRVRRLRRGVRSKAARRPAGRRGG